LQDVLGAKEGKSAGASQIDVIKSIAEHMNEMKESNDVMLAARKKANQIDDIEKRAIAYCDTVKIHFDKIRYHVDKLELLIDDEEWRLPKFREMLFTK
jgi:glutamine synthetase